MRGFRLSGFKDNIIINREPIFCCFFTNIVKTYFNTEQILKCCHYTENKTNVIHFVLARQNLDMQDVWFIQTIPIACFGRPKKTTLEHWKINPFSNPNDRFGLENGLIFQQYNGNRLGLRLEEFFLKLFFFAFMPVYHATCVYSNVPPSFNKLHSYNRDVAICQIMREAMMCGGVGED